MSTSSSTVGALSSVLTIGVGGLVAWVKRTLTNMTNDAKSVQQQAQNAITKVEADIELMQADLERVLAAVTPAKSRTAPAKKASPAKKANPVKKATKATKATKKRVAGR